MKKNLLTAILMTIATTILLGIMYPLVVTALAQIIFPDKANGQLIKRDGQIVGSRIIGQSFVGPGYFHSRPSAAGNGYDAGNSGGSNLGPTNQKLVDRFNQDLSRLQAENPGNPVPIDLLTTSASGLDPDIYSRRRRVPGAARGPRTWMSEDAVRQLITKHTEGRQLGFMGEPRVNVLELNLALDAAHPMAKVAENTTEASHR